MKRNNTKGFTLIELLIVIGILGILAAVVALAINPAEMLRRSRDSQRISDLGTMQTAINLALADTSISLGGTPNTTYASIATASGVADLTPFTIAGLPDPDIFTDIAAANLQLNNGNGWIPVNFGAVSSGAPISALPVDPRNEVDPANPANDYVYRFAHNGTSYKLDCMLESSQNDDREDNDGGNNGDRYEIGTNITFASN
ncbi:TPA: hypothetical protein DDW69_01650 [candidate division CPR2 bacterium]|uniref:Uncharacterized protein n=1 Tax=candidate division CPR2 bacterium GW2011_GWC1_41_48 TaxID=1618344 RepID=A0A0G0Z9L7_UNCC2|nr:MAG: hypothetical protein UT47_C0001G0133 [candidate division CPR2 bacterium GW2011_GWC2_39_35]KKR29441.1 MAG: hypothetical protein UT60_C0002G0032 [candidate division CPR2 bacterium GW2011_GWD2_39_7]KKR29612.1 MAG: hypothetical protein UT59_C0003G0003 [candidate division CPR2 bacterium GW2011_GWD1_39_7]KKS09728.1 MAG: hypothetical protein UU65_C0001G0133 [candidate division CPR2 bacterium GW2011_GWC1_41_48]OGB56499.1 MAG: hypothetical protein A2Y27_01185 [candidate division CPR2 bacterium G